MRIFILLPVLCITTFTYAQKITNFIMVNDGSITQDSNKATDFIVIKEYPDHHFVRLDYRKAAPLKKYRTFKDTALQVLDGPYYEYAEDGRMEISGNFTDNKKDGRWLTYKNDSLLTSVLWSHDSIVSIEDLHHQDSSISYPDEKEATFPGGIKAWRKYILKCMKSFDHVSILKGGVVVVAFVIDLDGSVVGVHLRRSMNYFCDEQSVESIRKSPKWEPAYQNGKNLKAYRLQPFTFEMQ